jgi:nicotinamidase-related amidase
MGEWAGISRIISFRGMADRGKEQSREKKRYASLHLTTAGGCTEKDQQYAVAVFHHGDRTAGIFSGEPILNQALLVIDVQNEYFTGRLPVTYPQGSLLNILKAMDWAHSTHLPTALIQHTNVAPGAATFRKGMDGWELHPQIKRRHADILIEKHLPGSFTGTGLKDWLEGNDITTVTIAGYMTQMCCDSTAREAFHRGYSVNFLADATGTLSVSNAAGSIGDADLHKAVLVTQQMRFARVVRTDEWIIGN